MRPPRSAPTFASLADGPLVATFSLTNRSGLAATPAVVNLTVDNTAPTNVVFASTNFVAAGGTYWTAAARPTLTGTVTEANPGATVTVLSGATPVGAGTVTGASWTATLTADVPVSTGFDLTIRITDAAGNSATSAVQRVARDLTPPAISSVAQSFVSEDADSVDFPGGVPRHTHAGAAVTLGGPSTACPTVFKHAYLTATSPQGTEVTANPLLFKWQVADQSAAGVPGGVGTDGATFRWRVTHVGSGTATPQHVVTGVETGGIYNVDTLLRRDGASAVPAIGVQAQLREGVFNVELQAADRLGNTTTLLRCMDYRPLGVPLERQTFGPTSNPLHAPLSAFQLASNSAISSLINGTHPGAGLMTVTLRNPTSETAYVTFSPSTINPRYSETWAFVRVPTGGQTTVAIDCGTSGTPPPPADADFCNRLLTGAPSPVAETHTDTPVTAATWGPPKVRVFQGAVELTGTVTNLPGTNCTTQVCATYTFALPPSATYDVVVGIPSAVDLGFQSATGTSERTSNYWRNDGTANLGALANTSLDATAALAPTGRGRDLACVQMNSVFNPGTGETVFTCVRQQRFAAQRYLASAGVRVAGLDLTASGTATSTTTPSRSAMTPANLDSQFWTTTETNP